MNETVTPVAEKTEAPVSPPVLVPPAPAPRPIPAPTPPVRSPSGRSGVAVASLLVSIASLLVSAGILALLLADRFDVDILPQPDDPAVSSEPAAPEEPEPPAQPEEPDVVVFREQQIPVEQVALNEYDPAGFLTRDSGHITYAAGGVEAIPGLDVSEFQGEVNWQQVKDSGMEFVMLRVGFRGYGQAGKLVADKNFEKNITGALDAGLKVGVYFFSQAINMEEAKEEARFVLDAIDGYRLDYPVVFDWERITNGDNARTDGLSGKAVTLCAKAFCDTVAAAGYQPAVYFNQTLGYLSLELETLQQYPFWLAAYTSKPGFYYHFDMWQYTAKGRVPGVQGDVDLNLSFRDFAAES
ncbi:MAG: hypothetical protein E7445_02740 [Ruminococcaceae bacterium]|nr:hypothetical protein [Oscillospiraceae bacterium]